MKRLGALVILLIHSVAAATTEAIPEPSIPDPAAPTVITLPAPAPDLPGTGAAPAPALVPTLDAERAQLLELVNVLRAGGAVCGGTPFGPVAPLTYDERLGVAAQGHALDMAARSYIGHVSADGRTLQDRLAQAGFSAAWRGENVVAGFGDVASALAWWLDSPAHCANLMNPNYTRVGFGIARSDSRYRTYWVQNFGTPK
ncbi:CAP domain-containing protein [Deinococcus soli (ex Cha et al. 2016)]|uniref:Uncharacterized protein YkwD n=2 Tax=Deinococcus soli (ex Cha et al. 2016) TaxID=1309411 RepID=A0AAE3XCU6_9DEIO|nr:CAP domain-containing protein [Deinococcus soli (ex Cha et al. 2016)]MDR6218147.1 uncharacterized protein YkwD [Deinococcus soli (ex Cha et al. 2016)]MDR6328887.1 uncharacterized protein YkwD [Deinococcus soli (ex Cha et al. 2016)]MDR6751625.1 uncharacterized protein YkwD [Deinococcus soli (ex Cha et al. 2016)]